MRNEQIILIAIFLFLLGLALLFFFMRGMAPEAVGISEISEKDVGKYVRVQGKVASARFSEGNVFIRLCSSECISVVFFKSNAERMSESPYLLEKGDSIIVSGTVEEYNGELEITPLGTKALEVR